MRLHENAPGQSHQYSQNQAYKPIMATLAKHRKAKPFEENNRLTYDTFKELFYSLSPRMIIYANDFVEDDLLSEDIVSEAFMQIWQRRENLTFENENQFKDYLYKTVKSRAIDHLRLANKEKKLQEHLEYLEHDGAITYNESLVAIEKAIKALSKENRSVIELLLEGYDPKAIASQLNITEAIVRKRKQRGIASLRKNLNQQALAIPMLVLLGCSEGLSFTNHIH
ncbi:RNA polymerase sigma factor [Dinghuibacter silviterrae]|uniref:RNA polymerase sigma factor (Sigma-70 family) n=1 Tax=Dinghuibacter silviterrae TaxID=1539049 RepID=A0A4V3GKV2_9BACT|nr:sigma-70 family RNA polymerase sigma factor [Dinghuibacter silviterrae]TDW97092.1 RNA polymerase sigma factor (sigma-70 family) [Dinghuibacter silviterrae]